jgi:glycosyltransferase involved in cell wall biosynthesis
VRITVLCTDLGIRVPGEKGASMHLMSITRALAAIGHDVQLIAVAGHGAPPSGLADVHLLPHPGRADGLQRELNKLAFVEQVATEMLGVVQAFAPHVIYERLSLFGSAGASIAATMPGCRHVLEVNSLLAEEESEWRGLHLSPLAGRVEREVLEQAHLAVAVSDEVAAKVAAAAPNARCVVVANGAEVERFRHLPSAERARKDLGLPQGVPMAAFVGALRPWHGVDLAIDAVAATDDLHLVVAGDGPIRTELASHAAALGLWGRVHFLGHVDHSQVAATLAAADVAIAPYPELSSFSFSPLKLYEYLAAGIPVVASAIGQIPAVLEHGRWGTLVPAGDVEALAAAMCAAASEPTAKERAQAARAYALVHHGWEPRARDIVELAAGAAERSHALA